MLQTGIPTVDLNDQVRDLGLPQIHSDHAAIARLAAEHLLERGFRHFAYFGFPVFEWSVRRHDAFAACVRAAGCPVPRERIAPRGCRGATSNPPGRGRSKGLRAGSRSCPSPWAS